MKIAALIPLLMICASAQAEPMRLEDPTPRWVVVQFEDSPSDRPDLLDRVYTEPFAAWLEADADGRIIVRIRADVLERNLFRANDPLPGSFSDYVWVFDPRSGEVLSASFSGAFSYQLDWGLATSEIEAHVRASMGTWHAGGFREPRSLWGRALIPYCEDVENARECTPVPSVRYDPQRGYVNAVGYLTIDSPVTQFATYSALGEARFSEIASEAPVTPPAASDATASAAADDAKRDTVTRSAQAGRAADVDVAAGPPAL